jgi:3-methylfumaryl-CoA hydratase
VLREWIGRAEESSDIVTAAPVAAMSATMDYPADRASEGALLPPLWHWLYFLPIHRQSEIAPDGHVRRGGFLPPVTLPRRMWAGSQLRFLEPLHVGDRLTRRSSIEDVSVKRGQSGALVFVKVRHEVSKDGGPLAIREFQDIVYREAPAPGNRAPAARAAPATCAWQRLVTPDAVLLFRYSALTFNGHRIHYDLRYATEVEGYPGLVVHGPLLATLLVDLLRRERPEAVITTFEFRALRAVFDLSPFTVCGEPEVDGKAARVWIRDPDGMLAMEGRATFG